MLLQSIISQKNKIVAPLQPSTSWGASRDGDYPLLTSFNQIKSFIWNPTTTGVATYNHHPFIEEHNGYIHALFTTHPQDEEGCGQYARYSRSNDGGETWDAPVTIFEAPDDITNDTQTTAGRVLVTSGFVIVDGDLYALTDVNDRSSYNEATPRTRTGVGILARQINNNGSFGTVYWIENVDGSENAPSPIPTYPAYTFNTSLRLKIRTFLINHPECRPDWYFSVPTSDILYSQIDSYEDGFVAESRIFKNIDEYYVKFWRIAGSNSDLLAAQTSDDGNYWNSIYNTDLPNSPSRFAIATLNNKNIALIGNNEGAVRDPLYLALSEDGFNYSAVNTYNIDNQDAGIQFSGIGKGPGVQYPHTKQLKNGRLGVIYSNNKEGIKFSAFDIPNLQ